MIKLIVTTLTLCFCLVLIALTLFFIAAAFVGLMQMIKANFKKKGNKNDVKTKS